MYLDVCMIESVGLDEASKRILVEPEDRFVGSPERRNRTYMDRT